MAKKRYSDKRRHLGQGAWTALTNAHFAGFVSGQIYTGPLKKACVPGLNCYSCPGALGACPIGALQAVIGSAEYKVSLYLMGFFVLVGTFLARFVCGWLCPFGLIQDLLHKIPFVKKIHTFPGDKWLRYLKYIILAVFVIILPLTLVNVIGSGNPYFCKLICPAGMIEGGWPLVALNPELRATLGHLFIWKNVVLALMVVASIILYRPFCKYLCPLGAIYGLFNKVSFYRYQLDDNRCISCGQCRKACGMAIDPVADINSPECIRCGRCKQVCPTEALSAGMKVGNGEKSNPDALA
ncbi:4Fe-4S binding protein [Peptococcus simiae]|uniref:4Fe-4S binding protein n=1 Tax=Peptococcus simiae TaxID=1643805 RepID=UPI00397F7262